MKAIVIEAPGEQPKLAWQEVEDAKPGAGEVLIRVAAAGVNRADLMQCAGGYPPPPGASPYPGLECAGVVAQVGARCETFRVGDTVCALLSGGGYAELAAVPEGQVLPVPEGVSIEHAAGIPEVFATAYANLYMEAAACAGEVFLVHAGASGVGTASIGLARLLGNPCYVTVGGEEKMARCLDLGASGACDRHADSFVEKVQDWTDGRGVDVILDPVGASYYNDNLSSLAIDGRLVLIGLMDGHRIQSSLVPALRKRLRIVGSTLRNRSVEYKSRVMSALQREVWPAFEDASLQVEIDRVFHISDIQAAHDHMRANANVGKIVLQIADRLPGGVITH